MLDVGIIGAGTAGTAAALFLARSGHAVTLYERVPNPGPVGAGIVLQPSGLAVLQRLGMMRDVADRGSPLTRLRCETAAKKTVIDLEYTSLGPDHQGYGLHRGVLFEHLHRAILKEPAIELRCGCAIDSFGRANRGKRYVVDSEGVELGPHDLIVVADGARSHLRDGASQHKSVTPYPWGALWFIGKDPENLFAGELHQIVEGPQRMLGFLPTGLGPGEGATPLVSLFWSLRADLFGQWQRDGLEAWKASIRAYAPHAEPLLEQIVDPQQITFAGYHDVVMDPWNTRNVVFIGDAAHATSPQLGQGCNLALYDAMILSDCVAEVPFLPSALDEYSRRRKDHLAFYQFATRWLTPFFQSDYGVLGLLRDALMGPMCRIPFIRREMVRSMTGTKAGMLFGDIARDERPYDRL